ncbi:UDP-galactose phosphate transferase, partial [Enterococcus faecalis]
ENIDAITNSTPEKFKGS